MRPYEKPEDIRARLRTLDRVARTAGADPAEDLTRRDVARMFEVMRRIRESQQARAR